MKHSEAIEEVKLNVMNSIPYELRNTLTRISGVLDRLQKSDDHLSESERRQFYSMIGLHTSEVLELVDQLIVPGSSGTSTTLERSEQPAISGAQMHDSQGDDCQTSFVKLKEKRYSSYDQELLKKLFGLMEDNLEETDFNIQKMCCMVHMSHMHFIRKVKQLTGKKPIDLLKSYRLKRAKDLLGQNNLTVAEIAYKIGYDMPNSFSRAFKKEFGISPSAYVG